jgi:hypothetical protein
VGHQMTPFHWETPTTSLPAHGHDG